MFRTSILAFVLVLLSGCDRAASPAATPAKSAPGQPAGWNDGAIEGYSASPPPDRGGTMRKSRSDSASARPGPGAPADEARSLEAIREERPGLGTEWGDSRASHVTDAPFARRSFESPWASSTLYYNDADGIRWMTGGAARPSCAVSELPIAGGALSVRLVDAWGSPLPTCDLGTRKYVTGRHGDRYVIEVRNHTGQRFEAVATVDGLDVIDGRPGSFAKRGYLIAPHGSLAIEGFRQSLHEVAEFRFGRVSNSYAARSGSDRNVGVIGVALFDERGTSYPYPWLGQEAERRHDAEAFPGRFAPAPR
jgi:hypothetical protein